MKALQPTETPRVQTAIDVAPRKMPDSVAKRRTRDNLDRLRQRLVDRLGGIMERVRTGLSIDDAVDEAREQMVPIFDAAARQGHLIAGIDKWRMTDEQVDALAILVEDELVFFRRFMKTIAAEAKNPNDRIRLYGGGVNSAFWRGWLALLPSTADIFWMLSVAEHCPDCIKLWAANPYTKPGIGTNPLPSVPRNGDTRCLGNCKCFLETRGSFSSGIVNHVGVEVTHLGTVAIDPLSPGALAAAQLYQDLAERFAYHKRMNLLVAGEHGRLADNALREIDRIAATAGHKYRFAVTMAEILEPITLALAFGLKYVDDLDDELIMGLAIVVSMNSSDRGKITRVQRKPPVIELESDPDRRYRLDAVGRNILFMET